MPVEANFVDIIKIDIKTFKVQKNYIVGIKIQFLSVFPDIEKIRDFR